jgi:NAD(P)-dependent dehydrogenase (short-subunit alcohol dehydrogenase family)
MQELSGKVAVVTGAASGIGRGLAEHFASAGMRLVLADIEEAPLEGVAAALRGAGSEVEAAVVDVREAGEIESLAERCTTRFGGAHVLCNNAGVAVGGTLWEVASEDWSWILGVNLVGVINGVRAFVPRMLASGEEGHVVNTASIAGLLCPALLGPYNVTKHAVVALSETLLTELCASGGKIGVSVLCPGWVKTRIHESDRNKPGGSPDEELADPEQEAMREALAGLLAGGMTPEQVAAEVAEAIRENRFWIRTHPAMEANVKERCEAIVAGAMPPAMLPMEIQ